MSRKNDRPGCAKSGPELGTQPSYFNLYLDSVLYEARKKMFLQNVCATVRPVQKLYNEYQSFPSKFSVLNLIMYLIQGSNTVRGSI